MINKQQSKFLLGFTLIELLVVVVIIGILATLTTVALNSIRAKARDAKRISDIKQMQTALELYFSDENSYPTTAAVVPGAALVSTDGTKTYMKIIPSNPQPRAEGACTASNDYSYSQQDAGLSYTIGYCLAKTVSGLPAGAAAATPKSINNACTPISQAVACEGKCSGQTASDGCSVTYNCGNTAATPPTTVTLVADNNKMTVNWSQVAGATQYRVYGNTNGTPTLKTTTSSLSYTETGLTNGNTYYYAVMATVCGANSAKSTQQSAVVGPNFSTACDSSSAIGSACSGGWLICKPGDGNCLDSTSYYVVAAPVNLTTSDWPSAVSACANYSNAGYTGWSLPKLSGTSPEASLTGDRIKNEMCQLMKRSNVCASQTNAGNCSGGCLSPAPIANVLTEYYWASNESTDPVFAWTHAASVGWPTTNNKTSFQGYVRCVRRF